MGSRATSYQVPEYRERSTKGTVVSGSRCSMPPQAAAARKILAIPSHRRVFMNDGNTAFTGTSRSATRREWFLTRFLVLSEKCSQMRRSPSAFRTIRVRKAVRKVACPLFFSHECYERPPLAARLLSARPDSHRLIVSLSGDRNAQYQASHYVS